MNITKLVLVSGVALLPLTISAQEQNASQQQSLQHVYETAKALTREDIPKLQKSAESGDIRQQLLLGTAYRNGNGVPIDYAKAFHWLRTAAEKGSEAAQGEVALLYGDGNGVEHNDPDAIRWLRTAADPTNPDARGMIGSMYETGQGVPADAAEAVRWYRRGAERGARMSQRYLADMYATGKGVPQDYTEAASWYRKAAAQGDVEAQKSLDALPSAAAPAGKSNPPPNGAVENSLAGEVGRGETSPCFYENEYLALTFHFPREWEVGDSRARGER